MSLGEVEDFSYDAREEQHCGDKVSQNNCVTRRPTIASTECSDNASLSSTLSTATSKPESDTLFAEPSQTMIFLDWDDTLFPTSELFERWGVPVHTSATDPASQQFRFGSLDPGKARLMEEWRCGLREHLEEACRSSERCVIITNSRRPWVTDCIDRFAPELRDLFDRPHRAPKVIYARECLKQSKSRSAQCMNLRPVRRRDLDLNTPWPEELEEELTLAKYAAMKIEAQSFYAQYPRQSWKNIINIGDMTYERDALQELTFKRLPSGKEKLRTKSIVLPSEASLIALTLRLQFSTVMLTAYVRYDGDFDLDLHEAADPVNAIGEALCIPDLGSSAFCRLAWSCVHPVQNEIQEEISESIAYLAVTVHDALYG